MKEILLILLGVGLLIGAPFLGLWSYSYFAPKYEAARRNVFEESKSYKHGTTRDLQNLMLEYRKATNEGHKQALKATILHRIAAFPVEDLTPELRSFVAELNQTY